MAFARGWMTTVTRGPQGGAWVVAGQAVQSQVTDRLPVFRSGVGALVRDFVVTAAAAARYKPGPGTPPRPAPEPGTPSGGPATVATATVPLAADGTAMFESGLSMYQPKDIGNLKWTDRYRRMVGLQAGTGLRDYPGLLLPALIINQFDPENYYPSDRLLACAATQAQVGASVSRIQLFNPPGSTILAIIEEIQAWR